MNAQTRTLLQVRSEDAVEADEIFTTLVRYSCSQRPAAIRNAGLKPGADGKSAPPRI